jgi:hypothetical protein
LAKCLCAAWFWANKGLIADVDVEMLLQVLLAG